MSDTPLKITGAEGLSDAEIKREIERGARLVIYHYCVSLLVVTFRRTTDIKLVPAGHSAVAAGLPQILVSLCFGWWGFPWGLIYTPAVTYKNLRGGTDVTGAWLAAVSEHSPDATPAQPEPPAPPKPPTDYRQILKVTACVLGALFLIYTAVCGCLTVSADIPVVLVNGLDRPYTVSVNGGRHELRPMSALIVNVREQPLTVTATLPLTGNPKLPPELRVTEEQVVACKDLDLHRPFFLRPLQRSVVMVNPDRLALMYREYAIYGNSHANLKPELYANQSAVLQRKPDYLLQEFPDSLRMKSSESRVRSRLAAAFVGNADKAAAIIAERNGSAAAELYRRNYALLHEPR